MKREKKITRLSGSSIAHVSYKDDHSLAETHDVFVRALPGQSYLKEPLHKVKTTQISGEAIMRDSVGGKGGFGSQGDVREQSKEINTDVPRMEKKEVFQQRLEVMQKRGEERPYFDFKHIGECDARDCLDTVENLYASQHLKDGFDCGKPFNTVQMHGGKIVAVTVNPNNRITKKQLDKARNDYDMICGYRGAWKSKDRYRITIVNTLNLDEGKPSDGMSDEVREALLKKAVNVWDQKMTHHSYSSLKSSYVKDDAHAMYEILDQYTPLHNSEQYLNRLAQTKPQPKKVKEKAKPMSDAERKADGWIKLRGEGYNIDYTRDGAGVITYNRHSDFYQDEIKPLMDNQGIDLRDWKVVYLWECTAEGKIMFANQKFN